MSDPAHGRLDRQQLEHKIESGEIETVITAFPDLYGRLMGKRILGRFFLEEIVDDGMHACDYLYASDMEMDPTPGYEFTSWASGYGDMRTIPDLSTLRWAAWLDRTAIVLCDSLNEEEDEPVAVAPRSILQRQVARAAEKGFVAQTASELEFFLFKESYDEAREQAYHGLRTREAYNEDYSLLAGAWAEPILGDMRRFVDASGIPVEFSKGEASAGQHELNLRYGRAVEMADRHVIYKQAAKEIAARHGAAITFMAKWDTDHAGSSLHVHLSFVGENGEAVFHDDAAPEIPGTHARPSETFRHAVGGMLAHARELSFFFAPNANSYKRYVEGTFAPTRVAWSYDNRTVGFRVVGHGKGLRIECRIPGADANPYLVYAALIAAALDGIERGTDPGPLFEGDGYAAETLPRVPHSLSEALEALDGSRLRPRGLRGGRGCASVALRARRACRPPPGRHRLRARALLRTHLKRPTRGLRRRRVRLSARSPDERGESPFNRWDRASSRPVGPAGPGGCPVPRKLRVEYRTRESFRAEYVQNISKGGVFVPTRQVVELRSRVELELALAFSDQSVVLPGEVVHCIPPEMAESGAQPGVAIQFLLDGDELRGKLDGFSGPVATAVDEREQGTGRRVAPRWRAHVPVELEVDGETIAAHTRNVSVSGALVELPGEAPAVGKKLKLRIQLPGGRDQMKVAARVARQLDAGGVACIGVELQVPEARRDDVGAFMERVRAVEHTRRLGGIGGPIADLGIRSVLVMFGGNTPEGMLTLTRGDEEGTILIDHGQLRAQLGMSSGREALDEMLSWTEGSFAFEGQVDETLIAGEEIPVAELDPSAQRSEADWAYESEVRRTKEPGGRGRGADAHRPRGAGTGDGGRRRGAGSRGLGSRSPSRRRTDSSPTTTTRSASSCSTTTRRTRSRPACRRRRRRSARSTGRRPSSPSATRTGASWARPKRRCSTSRSPA